MNSKFIYLTAGVVSTISLGILIKLFTKRIKKTKKVGIIELMKNTPLIYIKSLSELTGCEIYAKCEYYLPYTSKDRMIKNIILSAANEGLINKNTTVYEGSSGSTAYSVAAISRLLGFKCKIVVPDDVSNEKMSLLQTTGAEIIITKQCPFSNFKDNYVRLAKKMALSDPNGFYIDQFFNTINYKTHYEETGPEIYNDMNGDIDVFVSSSGTGGTIAGISIFLKEMNRDIKVFLSDVAGSGLHSYVKNKVMFTKEETEAMRKKYRYYSIIEGVGINFMTENFKNALIDDSFKITDEEAVFMANYVYSKDGIFIGGSSAVNLCATLKAAKKVGEGKRIVTILYDSGLKYTSKLFTPQILQECKIKSIEEIFSN
jgi:cysteine synthase A